MITIATNREHLTSDLPGADLPQLKEDIEEAAVCITVAGEEALGWNHEEEGIEVEAVSDFHRWASICSRRDALVAGAWVTYEPGDEKMAWSIADAMGSEWRRQAKILAAVVEMETVTAEDIDALLREAGVAGDTGTIVSCVAALEDGCEVSWNECEDIILEARQNAQGAA